jgi:predicted transcriptional regulator
MEATPTANPPSFETVWATLDRVSKKQEELIEIQKETDRKMKESAERLDKQMKETDRQLGKLGIRMGEVVEYMVAPNLREKFRELGYDFPQATQNSDVSDRKNKIFLEIDVKLENGDKVMLVEVKTKPATKDVKDHIKRLAKMRKYADLHGDKRTFLGAVAGAVMTDNVKEYALKQGFFAIESSGETFNIIPPNGQPKEW